MDLYRRLADLRRELKDLALRESSCLSPSLTVDPHVLDVIEDELLPALDLVQDAIEYDPTPQYAYDAWGGEPPLTMSEMHDAAMAERRELRGGFADRRA